MCTFSTLFVSKIWGFSWTIETTNKTIFDFCIDVDEMSAVCKYFGSQRIPLLFQSIFNSPKTL